MNCWKCGKEMSDGAKFCPRCGAMTTGGGQAGQNAAPAAWQAPTNPVAGGQTGQVGQNAAPAAWQAPANPAGGPTGKKRKGGALVIGGVVAVLVVVIAVAAAFAGGLFTSPKGKVEKALAKTTAAYVEAANSVGLPDWSGLTGDRSFSQRVSFTLNSIGPELSSGYDLSSLKGMGIRIGTDCDQEGRKLDFDLAAFYNGEDLASAQMLLDDNKLLFASPTFTGGAAYGMDTTTLGKDLVRLGAQDDTVDLEKIGFNLFDLMEKAAFTDTETEEMEQALAEARAKLDEAITVEKGGKEDIQVNGKSVNAERFHVVIPEDAVKEYIGAMEDVMQRMDTTARTREVLLSMGFDADMVSELLSRMDDTNVYGELTGKLREWADAAGDVELDVYLSGGYLCAAEYSGRIEDTNVKVKLQLGGGDNYVDNLSLEVTADGQKVTLESSGHHAGKDGVFTDETTIRTDSGRITSELRYEPKAGSDNFQWDLKLDSTASVSMTGQLTASKDSVELNLDKLSVKAAGSTLLSLKAEWYLGPCEGMKVSMPNQTLLGDMDMEDLEEMVEDIQGNTISWAGSVVQKLPAGMLMSLFG